jgi:hypothetical protein
MKTPAIKYLAYTFFMLLLFSCRNAKKEGGLKMEILNAEINSRGNIKKANLRNVIRFDNYIYDSLPVNRINVKITNSGTKTYVLFLDKNLDELGATNIKETVFKGAKIVEPTLSHLLQFTMLGYESRKGQNKTDRDSLEQEFNMNFLKEQIDRGKIRFQSKMNYVIVHPGEARFFTYYKTLPQFSQYSFYYMYKFNSSEKYSFQLSLENDAKLSKEYLTANQLKEIEDNGYTVFDGVVSSNKVPIKFIDIY